MVSRKDIEDFYKKYKKNLDAEAQVIDRLLQAEDQEIWLEKLRKKARSMRNLYIENEALLNLYVRPFLSGEVLLNDELADCFLHEIIDCRAEGYEDDLAFRAACTTRAPGKATGSGARHISSRLWSERISILRSKIWVCEKGLFTLFIIIPWYRSISVR